MNDKTKLCTRCGERDGTKTRSMLVPGIIQTTVDAWFCDPCFAYLDQQDRLRMLEEVQPDHIVNTPSTSP